jgi:hypothetical protein
MGILLDLMLTSPFFLRPFVWQFLYETFQSTKNIHWNVHWQRFWSSSQKRDFIISLFCLLGPKENITLHLVVQRNQEGIVFSTLFCGGRPEFVLNVWMSLVLCTYFSLLSIYCWWWKDKIGIPLVNCKIHIHFPVASRNSFIQIK